MWCAIIKLIVTKGQAAPFVLSPAFTHRDIVLAANQDQILLWMAHSSLYKPGPIPFSSVLHY